MSEALPPLPKRIETARLVLRPFELGDVDDVFAHSQDAEWARYFPVPQPYTRADAEEYVAQRILNDWTVHPAWAVEFEGHVIGGLGLRQKPNTGAPRWGTASPARVGGRA